MARAPSNQIMPYGSKDGAQEYSESQVPCFAPLVALIAPCFVCYSVSVGSTHLTFGYLMGCVRAKVARDDIVGDSVKTGSSDCGQNLRLGGWGIRMAGGGLTVYNPTNGPWVEFSTKSGKSYRFSTKNADKVAGMLRVGA
jgi:hypothetical protein